jgi:hypothetical protein
MKGIQDEKYKKSKISKHRLIENAEYITAIRRRDGICEVYLQSVKTVRPYKVHLRVILRFSSLPKNMKSKNSC